MPMKDGIHLEIATAGGSVYDDMVSYVELPFSDGSVGVLKDHAPMLGAIEEFLPKFWQYLKAKAKALGHKNGLPWYDLFAPMGETSTRFTAEQARDYLVDRFASFNPEEAQMIARAFDNAWIDFFPRDGKAGGAFCAGVPSLKESRILTNFDGKLGDVVTLAHDPFKANKQLIASKPYYDCVGLMR